MSFFLLSIKTIDVRVVLVSFLLLAGLPGFSQFRSASIRVDGLTCSMCSNSVERLVRTLDFVQDVHMDLNSNIAEVTFKKGSKVEMKRLAKSVKDAGYSVGFLTASFYFDSLSVKEGFTFTFEDNIFRFISSGEQILNGWVNVKFLGREFQEKKEYVKSLPLYSTYLREDKKKNIYYIQL